MALFGTGPARALDKHAIARVCIKHNWHPATLEAIAMAESAGFGWFRNGQIKILPEPHVFYRQLPKGKRAEAVRLGLAIAGGYKATRRSGHYRRMGSPKSRYTFFKRMISFDERAAYRSASYGTYQIMGFNARVCGYGSAKMMFEAFLQSEANQLKAFVAFLIDKKLVVAIRNRNFALVEKRYNGGGQDGAYAKNMAKFDRKLRLGKWKNWDSKQALPPEKDAGKAKDPDDKVAKPGTGGSILLPPGSAIIMGCSWEHVLAAFAGGLLAGVAIWFAYQWIKDRNLPRISQADDEQKGDPE